MGTIAKQTLRGSLFIYAGIALGFLSTGVLLPKFFSTSQIGALNLIIKYTSILTIIGTLGFGAIGAKLFPDFRSEENGHNGFFNLGLRISVLGFLFCCLLFFVFQEDLINQNLEKSPIFAEYLSYILPFTFAFVFYAFLNTYNKLLYDSVTGTFLKEFAQRIVIIGGIALFIYQVIDFSLFINIYLIALLLPVFGVLIVLRKRKETKITSYKSILADKQFKKTLISVGLFGTINSIAGTLVATIDTIMINDYLGESQAGIYATMSMFATVILAPSRPLNDIATTFLAEAWKENDMNQVKRLYQKSALNQLLFGSLVFVGIWANIDNVYGILPPKFLPGREVVFYLGLSALLTMAIGLNPRIIIISKHYRWQAYFLFTFAFLVIASNYFLIPTFGIVGAGIASFASVIIYFLIRVIFVWVKFKMQPFSLKSFLLIAIAIGIYFLQKLIPSNVWYYDLPIRSISILALFTTAFYFTNVSEDFNRQIDKILHLLKLKS